MDIETKERVAEIRRLNEAFRTTLRGARLFLRQASRSCQLDEAAALQAVTEFKDFNEENDPHEERDYGSFDLSDREFWWKIDYYNPTMNGASQDPADLRRPSAT